MEWMFLPLRRYAEFSGRSRRMEYWMFALFQVIVYVIAFVLLIAIVGSAFATRSTGGVGAMIASMGIGVVVLGLFSLAMLLPSIAVAVRRLHDSDRSGWWLMMYIGPYVFSVVLQIAAITLPGSTTLIVLNMIVSIVAFIAAITLLVFMCLPGTVGPNRYGPDPLFPDRNFAETVR